jgi:hypothetical protein
VGLELATNFQSIMALPQFPAFLGNDPLHHSFGAAFRKVAAEGLSEHTGEVGPGVYAIPMFKPKSCKLLLAEIDRRIHQMPSSGPGRGGPNSMHDHGVVLGELGMGEFLLQLREEIVDPLAARLFADVGGEHLEAEYGFLAEYGRDADDALGFHVDDSAVTLNVCLGERFSGSELYFRGLRCDEHRQIPPTADEVLELRHEPGVAILHAGRHRHGVNPILRGRRRNLILWCQSDVAKQAARSCQAWCGARSKP